MVLQFEMKRDNERSLLVTVRHLQCIKDLPFSRWQTDVRNRSSCSASYDQSPTNTIMQNRALTQPNSTESSTVFRKQVLSLILIHQKLAAFVFVLGCTCLMFMQTASTLVWL